MTASRKTLSAADVFGAGSDRGGPAQPTIDVKSLHAKIGELTLENDPKKRLLLVSAPWTGEQIRRLWRADANYRLPARDSASRRATRRNRRTPFHDVRHCRIVRRSCAPWRSPPWPCRRELRAAGRMRPTRCWPVQQLRRQAAGAPRPGSHNGVSSNASSTTTSTWAAIVRSIRSSWSKSRAAAARKAPRRRSVISLATMSSPINRQVRRRCELSWWPRREGRGFQSRSVGTIGRIPDCKARRDLPIPCLDNGRVRATRRARLEPTVTATTTGRGRYWEASAKWSSRCRARG
jgi:hypothetical protein